MNKARLFVLIVFLISSECVKTAGAQNPKGNSLLTISGTVVDAENNTPLSFASVAIVNKGKGTITNASGSFELSIPQNFQNDTLVISMMGYRSTKTPISSHRSDMLIKMVPQPVMLKEVEVTDERITVDDIFKEIRQRVKINYPVEEYAMECFYREIKKEDETYRSLLEAALVIRDKGYDQQKSQEIAYLREVRGSSKFVNKFSDFWQRNNLLRETLGLNAVRHPASTPKVFGGDRYQLQGTTTINDREVYVLISDIKPDDCWQRTLYVDVETYAIHRSEEAIRNYALSWKLADKDSVHMRLTRGTSMFDFKTINGRLYLNHIRHEVENEYFIPETKVVLQRFTIINDLVVNDIYESAKVKTEGLKKVENHALEMQVTPYNESFWKQYNGIKQTPLESKIMKDLVREGELNEQFMRSAKEKDVKKKGGKE